MRTWEELEQQCLSCTGCGLCETRHNVVFGVGKRDAGVLFVGEGPGEQEDLSGEPFVGPAGKLLDDMLSIVDLDRAQNCYIANIVKCRPPRNRDPMETEQEACSGYLRNQVARIKPKIIVCLGRSAAKKLIDVFMPHSPSSFIFARRAIRSSTASGRLLTSRRRALGWKVAIIQKSPRLNHWPCWRVMRKSGSMSFLAAIRPRQTMIFGLMRATRLRR